MKSFLLLLTFIPLVAFSQQADIQLLQGTWVLLDIQSTDSVLVSTNGNEQVAATSTGTIVSEKVKVAVKDQIKKSLLVGLTKFVFGNSDYQFFRKEKVTQSGSYKTQEDKLILVFNNKEQQRQKVNKITSISATQLVLETESDNKQVTLIFERKQ